MTEELDVPELSKANEILVEAVKLAGALEPLNKAAEDITEAKFALIASRAVADALQYMVMQVESMEVAARLLTEQAEQTAQRVWDEKAVERSDWAKRSNLAPSERFAQYKMDTRIEQKAWLVAKQHHTAFVHVLKQVKSLLFRVNDRRMDLHTIVKIHGFESSLDR